MAAAPQFWHFLMPKVWHILLEGFGSVLVLLIKPFGGTGGKKQSMMGLALVRLLFITHWVWSLESVKADTDLPGCPPSTSFVPSSVCTAGILIWRVLFVTSVRDTRGADLLSFNLSLNGQQIISLEQVGQWRGGAYAELGKNFFFFNVFHYFFENKPPQFDLIKVNIKQHVKRLCTKTPGLSGEEASQHPEELKRDFGPELVHP